MVKSKSYSGYQKRKNVNTGGGRHGQRQPHPMDVDKFQGMTLQQVEDRIRGLSHEELFVIDENGKIIAAYHGNNDSVAFPTALFSIPGVTVTHGHPRGLEGYGGTFSPKDIQNMAVSTWSEHRAAASGKGEFNYIVRRTSKTTRQNSTDLYNKITRDIPSLNRQMVQAANDARSKNLSASSLRQIYTGILDRYYSNVLPKYNFEYISKNSRYNTNR